MNSPVAAEGVLAEQLERIVAGLERDGLAIETAFLSPNQVEGLLREARQSWAAGRFHAAGVGRGQAQQRQEFIRGDHVLWLDEHVPADSALADYLCRMEVLQQTLNQSLYLGLFELETHFAVYPPGSYYRCHVDNFRGAGERRVTTILYLNPDWQPGHGGALRIYLDGEQGAYLDIPPLGGTLVTFLSERYYHEVLPTEVDRISLTGWFRRRA